MENCGFNFLYKFLQRVCIFSHAHTPHNINPSIHPSIHPFGSVNSLLENCECAAVQLFQSWYPLSYKWWLTASNPAVIPNRSTSLCSLYQLALELSSLLYSVGLFR